MKSSGVVPAEIGIRESRHGRLRKSKATDATIDSSQLSQRWQSKVAENLNFPDRMPSRQPDETRPKHAIRPNMRSGLEFAVRATVDTSVEPVPHPRVAIPVGPSRFCTSTS